MHSHESFSNELPDAQPVAPAPPQLPVRLRLLCIGPEEPSWVALLLQLDAAGCGEPQFRWVSSAAKGLALLRDESFDCVLVSGRPDDCSADTGGDPVSLLRAIRASGCDDPLVLIAPQLDDAQYAELYFLDAEVLITNRQWDSPALLPVIRRAILRLDLVRDNHRLATADHRRLLRERDEAEHLLRQQRQMIQEIEALPELVQDDAAGESLSVEPEPLPAARPELPEQINAYYHELLRTYVIIGSGSLGPEIVKLAEILAVAGLTPREALELHLERVESLVRGLGSRSSRHVMARADLLALELMIRLGDCYQTRRTARGDTAA